MTDIDPIDQKLDRLRDAIQAKQAALELDAARYRWLRSGKCSLYFARTVLNDDPHGIDAAVDAAMKA